MTIKEKTLSEIHQVFSKNKLYYRTNELSFATAKNGYSNHEGAVLRKFLRENGYIRARISSIDKKWLLKNNIDLKPSNVIIIKEADYQPRNPKIAIEEIVRITRFWLLRKVGFESHTEYYWVRIATDKVDGHSWYVGYKNHIGLVSLVGPEATGEKARKLEQEFQQAVKNQ